MADYIYVRVIAVETAGSFHQQPKKKRLQFRVNLAGQIKRRSDGFDIIGPLSCILRHFEGRVLDRGQQGVECIGKVPLLARLRIQ